MPTTRMQQLGAMVRSERRRRGLSQQAIATATGVSREWLSRLENGAPRLEAEKVLQVMTYLGLTVVSADARPTQADIATAQRVAWTMSLEGQPVSDEGFQRVLQKVVEHRLRRTAA